MVVTVEIRNHVPLQNQCLKPKVMFEATMVNNSDNEKQVYFGASDTTFKE